MNQWIRLAENDHVVIALQNISAGEAITLEDGSSLVLRDDVPKAHKILTKEVAQGEDVNKFGYSIGKARENLSPGCWVHTHNLESGLKGILAYRYEPAGGPGPVKPCVERTFQAYIRENGEVGIRNEIWILNTVGCINKTCEIIAQRASAIYRGRIDGVYHFSHPFGCSQLGDDLRHTQRLLASIAQHPNAAGVLVIGLGCENNQIDSFKDLLGDFSSDRIKFMRAQDVEDELETGLALIDELVGYAERFRRQPVPLSKLKLGLKCGGSDGFSGITANPLVGAVSDRLISFEGSAILTEVPEMFGAETILMSRAVDEGVFYQIVDLINEFKKYFIRHGQEVYENPSPGNKTGGISTLEEKSLGCTQKGGHSIVTDVLPYGQRSRKPGLSILESPGNDMVSVTALAAAGVHIVLFTTGRGTPFGGPVPTLKISTNSELAERKKNWIDFDAGRLLDNATMPDLTDELWEQILRIASGEEQTKSERNGFREIALFKDGVIL